MLPVLGKQFFCIPENRELMTYCFCMDRYFNGYLWEAVWGEGAGDNTFLFYSGWGQTFSRRTVPPLATPRLRACFGTNDRLISRMVRNGCTKRVHDAVISLYQLRNACVKYVEQSVCLHVFAKNVLKPTSIKKKTKKKQWEKEKENGERKTRKIFTQPLQRKYLLGRRNY